MKAISKRQHNALVAALNHLQELQGDGSRSSSGAIPTPATAAQRLEAAYSVYLDGKSTGCTSPVKD